MRVMVVVKATPQSETGVMPDDPSMFIEMGKFNDELIAAGVLLAAEGLMPSSTGAKVKKEGGKIIVQDGPFAEAKELIELHFAAELLAKLAADLVDRARALLPNVVLTEKRDLRVPLGDLAIDNLGPHGLRRTLLRQGRGDPAGARGPRHLHPRAQAAVGVAAAP